MHRDKNSALVAAAILLTATPFARATDYTFTGSAGNWSDPTNWASALVPPSDPASHVIYQGANNTQSNSTLDASRPLWTLNALTLNHTIFNKSYQLSIDPASTLQFAGPNPFLEQLNNTGATISGPINLTNGLTITNSGAGAVTLNGPISGSGPILYTPSTTATLAINGVNSFDGGITLAPTSTGGFANLSIGQPESLGSGNLTLIHPNASGFPQLNVTFQAGSSNTTTINNNIIITDQQPTFGGTSWIQFQAAGVTANHTYNLQHIIATTGADLSFNPIFPGTVTWNLQSFSLNGPSQISGGAALNIASIDESSPSSLSFAGTFNTVHITGPANYSAGTTINLTSLYADAPNALGTGAITLQNAGSNLTLNASAAAQNNITGNNGKIFYNANAAAGGHNLSIGANGTITLAPAVTSLGGDSFNIGANATLVGSTTALALLDRAVGSSTSPNLSLAPGSLLENADGGFPSIQNLGNNADLLVLFAKTTTTNFTLGSGTPWIGLGTTVGNYEGTLTANSNFIIAKGSFSSPSVPFKILVPAANAPVVVTIQSATLAGPSNFSGVDHFDATGRLFLSAANDLGGANSTAPATVNILANATLEVSNASAINGSVFLRAGSTLTIDSAGLTGTGTISRDNQPLTLNLNNTAALSGSQLPANFTQPGDNVLLSLNNIVGLKNLNPAANFILPLSSPLTQADGFSINAGSLAFSTASIGKPRPRSRRTRRQHHPHRLPRCHHLQRRHFRRSHHQHLSKRRLLRQHRCPHHRSGPRQLRRSQPLRRLPRPHRPHQLLQPVHQYHPQRLHPRRLFPRHHLRRKHHPQRRRTRPPRLHLQLHRHQLPQPRHRHRQFHHHQLRPGLQFPLFLQQRDLRPHQPLLRLPRQRHPLLPAPANRLPVVPAYHQRPPPHRKCHSQRFLIRCRVPHHFHR